MNNRSIILIIIAVLILLSALFSVQAAKLHCDDDGSFTIEKSSKKVPVYVQSRSGDWMEAAGEWTLVSDSKIKALRKYNFYADEGTFVSKGAAKHKIKYGKTTATVSCPAFRFSCRLFNVSIEYCYTIEGMFHAKYAVHNFDIDEKNTFRFEKPFVFRYDLVLPGQKRLTHAPTILSKEFADLNITMRKLAGLNKFILRSSIGRDDVQSLEMRYENCPQRKFNLYERQDCVPQPACTISKDCQDDEQCREGFCQKVVCGDCQYAVNNSCHSYECCEDSACAAEAYCQDNSCVALPCAEAQAIQDHHCEELSCADDEVAVEHRCQKLACAEDEAPQNHACVKLECADDEFIQEHRCVPLECDFFQAAVTHECRSWWQWVRGR